MGSVRCLNGHSCGVLDVCWDIWETLSLIIAYLLFEMFCQVMRVIICSAHRNMMELGKLTWKTHTVLRPAVITKGDCKSSIILKN